MGKKGDPDFPFVNIYFIMYCIGKFFAGSDPDFLVLGSLNKWVPF